MFSEFSAQQTANKTAWLAHVSKELKGADPTAYLHWEVEAGVTAEAFLVADEVQHLAYQQLLIQPSPTQEGANAGADIGVNAGASWRNCMQINLATTPLALANQKALFALNQGVEELCFAVPAQLAANFDFATLLKDILLPYCAVSFELETAKETTNFLTAYLAYCQSQQLDLQTLTGSISCKNEVSNLSFGTTNLPTTFKLFVVAPPSTAQTATAQLTSVLQQIDHCLTNQQSQNKDFSAQYFFEHLQIEIPIGQYYFVEISKLRALRLLVTQVAWLHGVANFEPYQVYLHAKTTQKQPKPDEKPNPNHYLLSNTTQAMAAVLGGCNSLTIVPHTTEAPEFGERIARNVSNLLREESYLDKVTDVGNGAYYVMNLTDKIAEKAWQLYAGN